MSKINKIPGGIIYRIKDEIVCVESYGENCIRVRCTRNGSLSDERYTLLEAEDHPAQVNIEEKRASVTSGILSAEISDRMWDGYCLSFIRNGEVILRTVDEGHYTSRFSHVEGDNYRTRIVFEANAGEHIYGLGQEQQDFFDKKGCTYELKHRNTKSAVPVVYSSLGYGFMCAQFEYFGRTCESVVKLDRKSAVRRMRVCYAVRVSALVILSCTAAYTGIANFTGILIPQLFPKMILTADQFFGRKG